MKEGCEVTGAKAGFIEEIMGEMFEDMEDDSLEEAADEEVEKVGPSPLVPLPANSVGERFSLRSLRAFWKEEGV